MPEYGILGPDQGRGLLPWSWARERLEKARNYWLSTTRSDARPHAMAVWGIWLDEGFYFSTGVTSRKARNLEIIPACAVCTERADEAVIVEGVAELVREPATLERLARVYAAKYEMPYPSDSNVYHVRPGVVFGFIEVATEFQGSATRWRFS
jgi:pyridoxine/pyridoxamine 5'-phosphate oxidase